LNFECSYEFESLNVPLNIKFEFEIEKWKL
jgi:hypothetical protein